MPASMDAATIKEDERLLPEEATAVVDPNPAVIWPKRIYAQSPFTHPSRCGGCDAIPRAASESIVRRKNESGRCRSDDRIDSGGCGN